MIRTTYKGRDIKILKSTTPHCVKTHIGGHVISHAWQGPEIQALDWFRRIIDTIDANGGPGHNPTYTYFHWYAPGTYDVNANSHPVNPGGACTCNACLAEPARNTPTTDPTVCQHCCIPQATHGRQSNLVIGPHAWTAPTTDQIKGRMIARRKAAARPA